MWNYRRAVTVSCVGVGGFLWLSRPQRSSNKIWGLASMLNQPTTLWISTFRCSLGMASCNLGLLLVLTLQITRSVGCYRCLNQTGFTGAINHQLWNVANTLLWTERKISFSTASLVLLPKPPSNDRGLYSRLNSGHWLLCRCLCACKECYRPDYGTLQPSV